MDFYTSVKVKAKNAKPYRKAQKLLSAEGGLRISENGSCRFLRFLKPGTREILLFLRKSDFSGRPNTIDPQEGGM